MKEEALSKIDVIKGFSVPPQCIIIGGSTPLPFAIY